MFKGRIKKHTYEEELFTYDLIDCKKCVQNTYYFILLKFMRLLMRKIEIVFKIPKQLLSDLCDLYKWKLTMVYLWCARGGFWYHLQVLRQTRAAPQRYPEKKIESQYTSVYSTHPLIWTIFPVPEVCSSTFNNSKFFFLGPLGVRCNGCNRCIVNPYYPLIPELVEVKVYFEVSYWVFKLDISDS